MKRFYLTVLVATVFLLGANAQTVIKNDYSTSESSAEDQNTSKEAEEESIVSMNLVYYGFDDYSNYGLSDYFINPNGVGMDLNIRMNFKEYGNYSFELGPNYSFKLWGQNKTKLFLTAAVGPSVRMADALKITTDSKGKVHKESVTKVKFDMFANVRLTFNAGRLVLSAGYFMWSPEFKFGEKSRMDGFNVALGYAF